MINVEDLKIGLKVELLVELPQRDAGLVGEIQEIEFHEVNYLTEPASVWIVWSDIKRTDFFDLSYSPNILNKLKIKD